MESYADQLRAFILAVLFHLGLIILIWISAFWTFPVRDTSASGPPMQATLMVSSADVRRAQQAIKASSKLIESDIQETLPTPQPLPSPNPQTSDTPIQMTPQAPLDQPDTVDQERIIRDAQLQAEHVAQEQEQRRRQEQAELTEDIVRQQEVERRQRLREQYEAIKREREAAEKRTHMEEQRLKQLADLHAKPATSAVRNPLPTPTTGNNGVDEGLLARYKAALNATVRSNWNTSQAPELIRCKIRFTQIPGGEVIHVEFIDCPYDAQGRDSVERALRKSPMPYSGFESVFWRQPTLTMCYPEEACQ